MKKSGKENHGARRRTYDVFHNHCKVKERHDISDCTYESFDTHMYTT